MKRIINFIALIITFHFSIVSLASTPNVPIGPDEVFIQGTAVNELKIMSYNVLNLFDADKDPGKDDWTWLPKNTPGKQQHCSELNDQRERNTCSQMDWTYEKVDLKLNQIKKVVSFQGTLPDIMAVVEVENANVVGLLAKKLGYKNFVITDSPDLRGIDVALMYNTKADLTFIKWESIPLHFDSNRAGRDLLRADFKWKNTLLSIYVNHWPSQRNPTEERNTAAQTLAQDIDKMTAAYGNNWSAVSIGDFNTTDDDRPNPFKDILLNPRWENSLLDAEAYARESNKNPALPYMPPGTFYYMKDDVWNQFDRVVVTKNLINKTGMEFVQDSYRILFPEFMGFMRRRFDFDSNSDSNSNSRSNSNKSKSNSRSKRTPFSARGNGDFGGEQPEENSRLVRVPNTYNFDTPNEDKRGFSDHLPVVFKLSLEK